MAGLVTEAQEEALDEWRMGEKHERAYHTDKNVQHISVEFRVTNWTFSDLGA